MALTLRATAALWSLVLEDYGAVISSILALATFAALFFLAYVLRKTLTPKPNPGANNKQAQVVRKKRRGRGNHYHNSVHHGRRGQHQRGVGGRAQSHAAEDSSASRDETGTSSLSTNALPALLEGVPLSPPPLQSTGRPTTAADDESIKAGSGHSASSVGAASTKVSSRERIMTEDTDDLSYDSVSGRSTPTMAVDLSSQHSAASSAGNLAASPVPHRQPSRRDAAIPRTMSVPTPAPKQGARKEAAVGGGRRKKAEPAPLSRVNNPPPASVKSSRTSATAGSSAMPNSQSVAGLVQTQGRWESLKPRGKGQQHHQLPSQPQPQPQPQSRQPRSRQVLTMQVQQPRVVASKQPRTPDNDKARSPKLASRDAATSGSTPSTKKSKNPATTTPSQTPPAATAASRGAQLVVNTAQPSPTPTVFYSPAREGAGTPGLGESNTTPFGTPMSFSSTTQQSSFFSTSAWDLKAAPSSSSYGPWAATDAATETTKPSRNQELQGMALDLGIGLGEITLGAPATSAFGHPASSFASIRPPPGLSLPPSLAANQCQEPSLSSVLPGLTASVPAVDDPVSTVLFPVSARAPGAPSAYSPRRRVRENPFEDETTGRDDDNNGDDDLMIEAELKELGGRIAGSVLDF